MDKTYSANEERQTDCHT